MPSFIIGSRCRCGAWIQQMSSECQRSLKNPQFIVDGMRSGDIAQGDVGDCWLLSGIAAMSSKPGLIEKICVVTDEQVGIYGFVFCRDGEWSDVIY
ncbi:hypothetical protein JB92DRAFT_3044626 [Gautieria morchelliformis]|nr:hypothetical protein JB92DRAFT_2034298 [Gautieria morchelliformis]KAF8479357.1 hypothetical protein JB92DRAFT_3044626 [Gautieria morchelliformis]